MERWGPPAGARLRTMFVMFVMLAVMFVMLAVMFVYKLSIGLLIASPVTPPCLDI